MVERKIEFKQYGMYRSGTCLIAMLVQKHLDRLVHSEALGNKHEGFNKYLFDLYKVNRAPHIKLLISIKNPYSWIVSFSKWTMKNGVFTDEEVRPLSETSNDVISRWCESYNHLYEHWMGLPYENYIVIYENLIRNPKAVLDDIRLKWQLKYKSFPNKIDFIIRPGHEVSYRLFDASYYYENRFMLELNEDQIECIRDSIDWSKLVNLYSSEPPTYKYMSDYQI